MYMGIKPQATLYQKIKCFIRVHSWYLYRVCNIAIGRKLYYECTFCNAKKIKYDICGA